MTQDKTGKDIVDPFPVEVRNGTLVYLAFFRR